MFQCYLLWFDSELVNNNMNIIFHLFYFHPKVWLSLKFFYSDKQLVINTWFRLQQLQAILNGAAWVVANEPKYIAYIAICARNMELLN